jgi:protoporphyrinogen/coproporphyrinogen III oxidase
MGIDRQTVVIGGGFTGLCCAYKLRQMGVPVALLEAADRPGGVIVAEKRNGFIFDGGPQCPRFPRAVWDLVLELGLEPEFVRVNPRAKRFVWKNGELHPAPLSPWGLIKTRLVGIGCKARFIAEPFGNWHPPQSEESLAEFIRRKFGDEAVDYLVDPFAQSVFFADPEDIGMESTLPAIARWERETGSVFRGGIKARRTNGKPAASMERSATENQPAPGVPVTDFLPPLGSFKNGFSALTDRLAERIGDSLRMGARVECICPPEAGSEARWRIQLGRGEEVTADSVVIAAPAYEAAKMLETVAPRLSDLLAAIPYSPLAVVSSGYDRAQVRHSLDGFGFNVPKREGLHTISCTWNSSLFPRRAPEGKVLITSFARPLANEDFLEREPEEIARIVEGEAAKVLGISGAAVDHMVWKHSRALPQYRVGHAQRVAAIRDELRGIDGLHLIGNYLEGRSVGDSVHIAFAAAEEVSCRVGALTATAAEVGRR